MELLLPVFKCIALAGLSFVVLLTVCYYQSNSRLRKLGVFLLICITIAIISFSNSLYTLGILMTLQAFCILKLKALLKINAR
jgi:hypothetical protein